MAPASKAIACALLAALLFGLSPPLAKRLLAVADPWLLAGLLYLGSGLGLGMLRVIRNLANRGPVERGVPGSDLAWLAAAIVCGGVVGPVLLMFGLAAGPASQSALLLNLESVFTTGLAWLVFREHVAWRIAVGMAAITFGALALAWEPSQPMALDHSAVLVAAACLAWALDNNVTRRISGSDPLQIAALKGTTAGVVNVAIALGAGARLPAWGTLAAVGALGLVSYGVSLVLFVRALRHLGAGRTGAYFATAPFCGAFVSVLLLGEPVTGPLVVAGLLMSLGVWLHVTEYHEHHHQHDPLEHEHLHWHDEHHLHEHAPGLAGGEPHTHRHGHGPLSHCHPHYPDLHHRHRHP